MSCQVDLNNVECTICCKMYNIENREPLKLSCCKNNICKKCLSKLNQDQCAQCPFCRQIIIYTSKDKVILEQIKKQPQENSNEQKNNFIKCRDHEGKFVQLICQKCQMIICNKCLKTNHNHFVPQFYPIGKNMLSFINNEIDVAKQELDNILSYISKAKVCYQEQLDEIKNLKYSNILDSDNLNIIMNKMFSFFSENKNKFLNIQPDQVFPHFFAIKQFKNYEEEKINYNFDGQSHSISFNTYSNYQISHPSSQINQSSSDSEEDQLENQDNINYNYCIVVKMVANQQQDMTIAFQKIKRVFVQFNLDIKNAYFDGSNDRYLFQFENHQKALLAKNHLKNQKTWNKQNKTDYFFQTLGLIDIANPRFIQSNQFKKIY